MIIVDTQLDREVKKQPLILISLLVLSFQQAFAYIDPGSGSAIMSAVIGFFVAIGVVIKTYWYKITGLLNKLISKSPQPEKKDQS